jgi:hypothetical protein
VLLAVDDIALVFAVFSELNETCILSIPSVNSLKDSLKRKLAQNSPVVCESTENNTNAKNDAKSFVITRSQAKCHPSSSNANNIRLVLLTVRPFKPSIETVTVAVMGKSRSQFDLIRDAIAIRFD